MLGLGVHTLFINAQQTDLYHLSSYNTGVNESAEVVAYDASTQRAFFTSASTNNLSIIDISDPENPTLFLDFSLSEYGGAPNSVAIHNGLVAVAVEDTVKTANGKIIFLNNNGIYLGNLTVGALPDMLTFTPDGTKLLVANEGEPNDDYTIDPEGSVSIIDLSAGLLGATVTTVDFTKYNNKKASLINKGIRIFGNNNTASVAEDMEPEYISITEDGSLAYVNCQENNAFAVIDLSGDTIIDILPLGYKNHLSGTPSVTSYTLNQLASSWPTLGTPVYDGGQPTVMLGGFSGLYYADDESNVTNQVFYAVPDRGPNAAVVKKADVIPTSTQNIRPFKLPNYQARISKFTVNRSTGNVTLGSSILLFRQDGITPITGKGNIPGEDEVPVTYADAATAYPNTDYTDNNSEEYHELSFDEFGGDLEGVLKDKNGDFWLCDEYRPAIYKFQPNGTLIDRYVASGTSLLGTTPLPIGTYGNETLPAIYTKRRANRGFEAIAYDSTNHIIYAFIQSPLYNPSSVTKDNSDVIRILGVDASTGNPVSEYVYLLERNKDDGYSSSRVDKIGDAVFTGNGKFLVIERDSEGPTVEFGKKYVFEIDINSATNILNTTISLIDGSTPGLTALEELTTDQIVDNENITPVQKLKVVNLPSVGYQGSDKAEGIALLPNNEIAVLNDNDFGLAGAGITDNSVLGIISFANNYSFDASDKDNGVNITAHPTLGMYMPDGIASYEVNGINYIVTANEGDSRDYDGYSEEKRVKNLTLDSVYYPNAAILQVDSNLGRLKTTTATGDYNNDGKIDQIYSYGGRSFSIFDEYGNLVFDSGNEISQTILTEESTLFNEDEGEEDKRSDDKGSEPEAIAIGEINGFTYAFIGLERQSAILVYDITNPKSPNFITYYNNRTVDTLGITGDVAPEIIKFINENESPNGENILLVGYEESGSVGIIQIGGTITSISEEVKNSGFNIYPNPLNGINVLNFNTEISGTIFNINGQVIMSFENEKSIDTSTLSEGVYIIKTKTKGTKRFVKL